MERRDRIVIAVFMVIVMLSCTGCKIKNKTTETKQENENVKKELMKKLSSSEKRARKDSKDIEKNEKQIKQSLVYIDSNLGKAKEKENQPEMMENAAYLYNLIVIRKDVHENKKNMTQEDKNFIKKIENQNITKMSRALYNYLLSSGEAEYKDSLNEAEKYMNDIKKTGLHSEVKKLIEILKE